MTLTGYHDRDGLAVSFDQFELALLGNALLHGNKEDEPNGAYGWRVAAANFFLAASLATRLADETVKSADEARDFIATEPAATRNDYFRETGNPNHPAQFGVKGESK